MLVKALDPSVPPDPMLRVDPSVPAKVREFWAASVLALVIFKVPEVEAIVTPLNVLALMPPSKETSGDKLTVLVPPLVFMFTCPAVPAKVMAPELLLNVVTPVELVK